MGDECDCPDPTIRHKVSCPLWPKGHPTPAPEEEKPSPDPECACVMCVLARNSDQTELLRSYAKSSSFAMREIQARLGEAAYLWIEMLRPDDTMAYKARNYLRLNAILFKALSDG